MATILVVEDDKNTRLLTTARLKPHYTVLTACDGEEALYIFYKQHVDLIIADIMLTAKASFDDKRQGFSTGTDDYMTKPVNYEELLWRIAKKGI